MFLTMFGKTLKMDDAKYIKHNELIRGASDNAIPVFILNSLPHSIGQLLFSKNEKQFQTVFNQIYSLTVFATNLEIQKCVRIL